MATFNYEELEYRYNPYTKQIEKIDVEAEAILSTINLSNEWVYITWDRIQLDWNVSVLWTFSINSSSLDYIDTNDLGSYTSTADWIYMTSAWFTWYYDGTQTINIDATTWDASFTWEINAQSWSIQWQLTMDATDWVVASSDYDEAIQYSWWRLWEDWLFIWEDKWVSLNGTGRIDAATHWYWLIMDISWISFTAYTWADEWFIHPDHLWDWWWIGYNPWVWVSWRLLINNEILLKDWTKITSESWWWTLYYDWLHWQVTDSDWTHQL